MDESVPLDFSLLSGVLTESLEAYEQPARGTAGRALAVARPATVADVQTVVRWAIEHEVRLLPQGANTGLVGASTPESVAPTLIVSTERLTAPFVVDRDERTASVGAGVRLSTLNDAAARHGLQLPIDLAADPSLGGMVSTNTGGTRVLRYGPLAHHVQAIRAVAADREATVFGGRALRKDSRGIDLNHLLIGGGGTLGIITDVVVALTPVPAFRSTWWVVVRPDREIDLLTFLDQQLDGLSAFELVSRNALSGVRQYRLPFVLDQVRDAAALIEVEASSEPDLSELFEMAEQQGLIDDAANLPTSAAWAIRHAVTDGLRAMGTVLGHDVAVPRSELPAMRAATRQYVAEVLPRALLCDFGHVGDGGLHLNVLFPHAVPPPSDEERRALRSEIDRLVSRTGTYSAEHGLGPLNAARWLDSTTRIEQDLIGSMKRILDPFDILGHPGHPYNLLKGPKDEDRRRLSP